MTEEAQAYSPGDWIVHRQHGVGQIKGTEVMNMGGGKNTYCRIETRDSTVWVPREKMNADWLRPLAAPGEMQQALEVLADSPGEMEADPNRRKIEISKIKPDDSPVVIAEILRDLSAHNKEKKQVSQTDMDALRHLTDLFLAEWSVCMNLEMGAAKQQLNALLAEDG